eukprot:CAMPEP_0170599284 /NCGR_PEP_ID=MMETSP0224-20130122/16710_1 /TAXON_ID=285029 /ORGANISM="Togula jolla, Strain CCCM 725" /LENGTH=415 /DNA_ID=CAMNT_0010923915 /DNA_START=49 /DNA_END=1296 /DNA_ORIENTATION=-
MPTELDVRITGSNLEPKTCQVLEQILNQVQMLATRCGDEHGQKVELESENKILRRSNERLREENDSLKAQLDGHVAQLDSHFVAAPPRNREREESGARFVPFRTLELHSAPVHSVSVNPNKDIVASASWDSQVKLTYLADEENIEKNHKTLCNLDEKMGGLYAVAFSKNTPNVLGCTSCDKYVYLWNHVEGKQLSKLAGHADEVNAIDFHTSQQVMVTASDDMTAKIWDFQEGICLRTLEKHTKQVYGASFLGGDENQYLVATCCFDMCTRIYDMRSRTVVASCRDHNDDVIGIDYSTAKQQMATSSDDGLIIIYDARNWSVLNKINTKKETGLADNEVKRIAFSPAGDLLAAACSSQRVLVYDTAVTTGAIAQLKGHADCVFDVTWGVNPRTGAKVLVSASHDFSSKYWREVLR